MLFFIFVAILVAGIVFNKLSDWSKLNYELRNNYEMIGIFGIALGIVVVGVSTAILLIAHIPAQANLESYEVERASLVYQYENNLYDNDNDIGKKELMSEIQKYNESLVSHKSLQRNFWVGIYYPNIYDELELIDISSS